jgi:hypothetical protein
VRGFITHGTLWRTLNLLLQSIIHLSVRIAAKMKPSTTFSVVLFDLVTAAWFCHAATRTKVTIRSGGALMPMDIFKVSLTDRERRLLLTI